MMFDPVTSWRTFHPDTFPDSAFWTANAPSHDPRIGIVEHNFADSFCCKIANSHDALQTLIGEGPVARFAVAAGLAILALEAT